jgi:hypothetical protein
MNTLDLLVLTQNRLIIIILLLAITYISILDNIINTSINIIQLIDRED